MKNAGLRELPMGNRKSYRLQDGSQLQQIDMWGPIAIERKKQVSISTKLPLALSRDSSGVEKLQ